METAYYKLIDRMAYHALAGGMLALGINPVSESFEYKDCGPHRIYMLQGSFEPNRHRLDANIVMHKLHNYFQQIKNFYPKFEVYEVSPYGCFNQDLGLMVLMVSICHTA